MIPRIRQWQSEALRKLPVKRWLAKVNALPQRDRMAMLAGGLALIIGFEFQAVMPVHDRRMALLASQPGSDPLQQQNEAQALQSKQAELAQLQQTLSQRTPLQAVSAQGGAPRDVFAVFRKAMALQEVEVVALQALPDEPPVKPPTHADVASAPVEAAPVADAASDVAPTEAAAAPAVSTPAPAEPSVYRHRAELKIAGTLAHVNQVLKRFEQGHELLRLERVKLVPSAQDARTIEATLSLILISQEKTWLAM
ncbi:MAG: hypothetical protein ACM3VZ_10620 [Acidobacteriota bacterium]